MDIMCNNDAQGTRHIKDGLFVCSPEGSGGSVTIKAEEYKTAVVICLKRNTCRYTPALLEKMFEKHSFQLIIRKDDMGQHTIHFGKSDTAFELYPFREGIPFTFRHVENKK